MSQGIEGALWKTEISPDSTFICTTEYLLLDLSQNGRRMEEMSAPATSYGELLSKTQPEVVRDEEQNQLYIQTLEELTAARKLLSRKRNSSHCSLC